MTRRQTAPQQWLIVDERLGDEPWPAILELPLRSGVLTLVDPSPRELRRLRHLARLRDLTIVREQPRRAARVHDARELRQALLRRTTLVLLSPLHETRSHPDFRPLPRMRAAALARLAKRKLTALGGMNPKRYAKVAPLGFVGWAGISAWLEFTKVRR